MKKITYFQDCVQRKLAELLACFIFIGEGHINTDPVSTFLIGFVNKSLKHSIFKLMLHTAML